ncbi:apolipoprotein N-acyltransferase [Melioribacteraceae bacterium 4301-Me]|uniref:apolipoprotein N-acyltransferase n=1 Tax=Pyranulibacter aquaticus TaxID=3163344 RepID=UPI00359AD6E6
MKGLFGRYKIVLTPEQRKKRNKDVALVLISGFLMGISYPPLPLPYFIFIAFVPLLKVIDEKETLGEINRYSYLAFFVFTLITLYWVGSWTKEADPFLMISGFLLLFVNPALYLIPTTIYFFCKKSLGKKVALYLFPFFWVSFEYLYSLTDLRFPWLILANSLVYFNTFIQITDVVGAYGLSLIVLFINVLLFNAYVKFKSTHKILSLNLCAASLIFVIVFSYGLFKRFSNHPSLIKVKLGLIQPDLNPWAKWEVSDLSELLNIYLRLSQAAVDQGAKIIIWPESALPVYLLSGNYEYEVERIKNFVRNNKIYLLTGMPDANFYFDKTKAPKDAKPLKGNVFYTSYNSILLFSPFTEEIQKYQKIKLVPFGEKVPFVEEFPFLGDLIKWQVGISSWNEGKDTVVFKLANVDLTIKNPSQKKVIISGEIKVGGLICIESIYPDFVASFVQRGANLIAVVTNDSWYGYSSGPFQHEAISILRAVENRRTVVRAANGGVSCIINPLGKILNETKLFTKSFLVVDAGIEDNLTFYTKYPLIFPLTSSFVSITIILLFTMKMLYHFFNHKGTKRNE